MGAVQTTVVFVLASTASVSAEVYVRVGTAAVELTGSQGNYLFIYPSVAINVTGEVVAWEFYAKKSGIVFLSLWDVIGENEFRLHNKTEIMVAEPGRQVFFLPEGDRFQARVDQIVGVHSKNENGGWIVSNAKDNCCNMKTQPIHRRDVQDNGLPLGKIEQGVNVNYNLALAVLVHIKMAVAPVVTMTGPGPLVSSDKTNRLVCYDVLSRPPGMLSYYFDCGTPVIKAVVKVTMALGSCEAVFVFGTVRTVGQESLHRRCPRKLELEGDVTCCSYACSFDPETDGHVTTGMHLRIHHQVAYPTKVCSVEI